MLAIGALQAARMRGINVPEQLSVVGFDDTEEASLVTPALTTVRQPLAEMGRMAVKPAPPPARRAAVRGPPRRAGNEADRAGVNRGPALTGRAVGERGSQRGRRREGQPAVMLRRMRAPCSDRPSLARLGWCWHRWR
jgi:hypothetical protein